MAKKRTSLSDRLSENDKDITRAVSAFISDIEVNDETGNESKKETKCVSKNDTKKETKYVSPKVSKKVSIGNYKFHVSLDEEMKRIPYLLSSSTIEKINTVSSLTNLKKYELVNLILSSVCDEILKKSK